MSLGQSIVYKGKAAIVVAEDEFDVEEPTGAVDEKGTPVTRTVHKQTVNLVVFTRDGESISYANVPRADVFGAAQPPAAPAAPTPAVPAS